MRGPAFPHFRSPASDSEASSVRGWLLRELGASSFELRKPQSICGPAPSGRVDAWMRTTVDVESGGVDGSRAHDCAAAAAVLQRRAIGSRPASKFAVTYLQEVCRPPKAFRKYGIKWVARSVRPYGQG